MSNIKPLIKILGENYSHRTESDKDLGQYEVYRWIKGYDTNNQPLFFEIHTTNNNKLFYSYTANDMEEISDFGKLEEILKYAKEFLQYVHNTPHSKRKK